MSLRVRILVASLLVALVPFAVVSLAMRRDASRRLSEFDRANLQSLTRAIEIGIAESEAALIDRLATIRDAALDDNELRRALLEPESSTSLIGYAPRVQQLSGLAMLQLQDESGRILSAGQFRNDYGRIEPHLPHLLRGLGRAAVIEARIPHGVQLVLARSIELPIGGHIYTLIGGVTPQSIPWLDDSQQIGHLRVRLRSPDQPPGADGVLVGSIEVPFFSDGSNEFREAVIEIQRVGAPLEEVLRGGDRWFAGFVVLAVVGAGILGLVTSAWVSRPLRDLAEKTTRVHLRHARVRFDSGRRDEVGDLSRFVGGMVDRLQEAAAQLQEAERRATLGELARQVNHDVKNGVTPIRNVVRHLAELSESDPGHLPDVFRERRSTLESSLAYLEELASNYARLSPRLAHEPTNVNEVLRQVESARLEVPGVDVRLQLAPGLPAVLVDPLGLRRVLENLIRNAVEAVTESGGTVRVQTALVGGANDSSSEGESRGVQITLADNGPGLSEDERSRIFEHFYTTKATGTGLGLSIVKRLVTDFGGTLGVESEPGRGSVFVVTLPTGVSPARAASANNWMEEG